MKKLIQESLNVIPASVLSSEAAWIAFARGQGILPTKWWRKDLHSTSLYYFNREKQQDPQEAFSQNPTSVFSKGELLLIDTLPSRAFLKNKCVDFDLSEAYIFKTSYRLYSL